MRFQVLHHIVCCIYSLILPQNRNKFLTQIFFHFSQFINDNISSRPISFPSFHEFGNPTVEAITGSSVVIIDDDSPFPEDYRRQEDFGEFHEATANIEANHQLDAMCGNITEK